MEIKQKEQQLCQLEQCETFYMNNSVEFDQRINKLFDQKMTKAAIICIGIDAINEASLTEKYGDYGVNAIFKIIEREIIDFCNEKVPSDLFLQHGSSKKLNCVPYKSKNSKNELNIIFINTNDNNNLTEAKVFVLKLLDWLDITCKLIAKINVGMTYLKLNDKLSDEWILRGKKHLILAKSSDEYSSEQNTIIDDIYSENYLEYNVGDSLLLPHGKTGIIKYVGNVNFQDCSELVVGLELESWDPNGSDGTIKGSKLFDTSAGRAWFIHPSLDVMEYTSLINSKREGCHARLKGLVKKPQWNDMLVYVVSYVPQKSRWKVRYQDETKDGKWSYLGVKYENLEFLDGMIDIKSVDDINIGYAIKIKSGQWGVVRYIGKTFWSDDDKVIGLKLLKWSPNAKNGTVKTTQYFVTNYGYGYFTHFDNIVNVVPSYIAWCQERIIWIAYYKNMQNTTCLFNQLPKDIIKHILSFVGDRGSVDFINS